MCCININKNVAIAFSAFLILVSCVGTQCDGCGGCDYVEFQDTVIVAEIYYEKNDPLLPIYGIALMALNPDSTNYKIEGQFLENIRKDFELIELENNNQVFVLSGESISRGSCPPEVFDSIYILRENHLFTLLNNSIWETEKAGFNGLINIRQDMASGDLEGNHQFVNYNGTRIDACENTSIFLSSINKGKWVGVMKDCYFGEVHQVELKQISTQELEFIIIENEHIFLPDTFTLARH